MIVDPGEQWHLENGRTWHGRITGTLQLHGLPWRFGTFLRQKVYRGLTHLITGLIGVSDRLTELINFNCWRHFIHVYWRPVERWSKPNDHLVILIYPFRKTFRDTFATTIFAFAKASGHYHLSRDFRGESGLNTFGFDRKNNVCLL